MRKKFVGLIAVVIGIALIFGFMSFQNGQFEGSRNSIFHVTLANPENYENGVFTDSFEIKKGTHRFGFVPNGDSPQTLTITLEGESIHYNEKFTLEGTPHDTGISTYYTWEYAGNFLILIPEDQTVEITIDPNGNLQGPVSVDIL